MRPAGGDRIGGGEFDRLDFGSLGSRALRNRVHDVG
jgi:hypothetical protein